MPELFDGTVQTTINDNERFATNQPGQPGSNNILWSAFKTLLATLFCSLTGNQTIAGTKTFSSSPQVPDPTTSLDAVNYQTLLNVAAPMKVLYADRTASFQHALSADNSLERIDIRPIAGTATVKVGTTAGSSDIASSRTVTFGDEADKNIILGKSFNVPKTLYITISGGGTVSINIWELEAIF